MKNPAETRTGLNTKIGAGELDGAIIELMTFFACTETMIERDLIRKLNAWIFGYTNTPAEGRLRGLLALISPQCGDGQVPHKTGRGDDRPPDLSQPVYEPH